MRAGKTDDDASGGMVSLMSGYSSQASSGNVIVATPNAGVAGVSGTVSLVTGSSSAGNSGAVVITTGTATSGFGGNVQVMVGASNSGTGGNILLNAVQAIQRAGVGGSVVIAGGEGSNAAYTNGNYLHVLKVLYYIHTNT